MNKPIAEQINGMLETVDRLSEIIKIQSDIIDGLFTLALQHVTTEDETLGSIMEDMELAGTMRREEL